MESLSVPKYTFGELDSRLNSRDFWRLIVNGCNCDVKSVDRRTLATFIRHFERKLNLCGTNPDLRLSRELARLAL